jgi:hypothetical protein
MLRGWGKTLALMREERVEWELREAGLAREFKRMMGVEMETENYEEMEVEG